MKILACDTTHGTCSVALLDGDAVMAQGSDTEHSKQAERLFAVIGDVLARASCTYNDLGAVAVTIGPGSFTGVRIGIAAARGIALAADIPVIGVTSFESVAQQVPEQSAIPICVALDAKRGQAYVQSFSSTCEPLNEPQICDYNEVGQHMPQGVFFLAGSGLTQIEDQLDFATVAGKSDLLPEALSVARVAMRKYRGGQYEQSALPLYIRLPDAKVSQE